MLSRYVVPDMPSADELLPYLRQIDHNKWYSNFGPLVTEFERRLARHLSATADKERSADIHLTTVMTCYHALQIGLQLFRLPKNAQVLVPAVTFPACPLAVHHAGAEAVLADIDRDSWHLTPDIARRVAGQMPIHAVMPVAVYGVPVPVKAWDQFSEETGIPVIIDAAAALEVQDIPRHGFVAHSMHATKPFGIGEGGILISRNRDLINEARCLSNFGTEQRISIKDGSNAKMSEYQGAVALAQLDRWATVKQKRQDQFTHYRKLFEKSGLDLKFQGGIEQAIVSALMLKAPGKNAGKILDSLNANGILAHRMYLPPLYHHPHFSNLTIVNSEGKSLPGGVSKNQKKAFMKNSEMMLESIFGVPFHTFMDQDDMVCVIKILAETVGTMRAA